MKQTELQKKLKVGARFRCKIEGVECEGRLQFECGRWYLCQNIKDGFSCIDKLGYKYSYTVLGAGYYTLEILPDEPEERDWQEGDVLEHDLLKDKVKVIKIMNGTCLLSRLNNFQEIDTSALYTKEEIVEQDWKLYTEPTRITITLDDAISAYAEKFGVDKNLIDLK